MVESKLRANSRHPGRVIMTKGYVKHVFMYIIAYILYIE